MGDELQGVLIVAATITAALTVIAVIFGSRALKAADQAWEAQQREAFEQLNEAKRLVVTAEFDDGTREVLVKKVPNSQRARKAIQRALSYLKAA